MLYYFILNNFNNYNSRLIDSFKNKEFKNFINKYFNKFLEEGEEQSDEEADNIPYNTSLSNIKSIKSIASNRIKNTNILKKITDLIKIDYNNINIINESKFDSLTIFIQNIKR